VIGEHGDLAIKQREINILPLSGFIAVGECAKDTDGRVHARHHVGNGNTDFLRVATGFIAFTCNTHHPAHGLDHEIIASAVRIGARLSKTRYGTIY